MIEFLLADYNVYYAATLIFVVMLALIEGLGLIIGLSLMSALDDFFSLDVDADIDVTTGGLTSVWGWLCLNKLPVLIWLVIFFASFGVAGYTINYLTLTVFSSLLPVFIGIFCAVFVAVFFTKFLSTPLAKLLPKNESSAQSNQSFVGLVGRITVGKASFENPAEAVIYDSFNQKHYVLVAPEFKEEEFKQGSEIVLLKKLESYWLAAAFNQCK